MVAIIRWIVFPTSFKLTAVRSTGYRFSVCKPDYLMINIDRRLNSKGNDATRLRMPDIDIVHDGQARTIDCIYQYLFVFLCKRSVHRLAYEDT